MTLIAVVGLSCLLGIFAGFLTARRGAGWMVLVLWLACAVGIVLYAMWLDAAGSDAITQAPIVLYGGLIPFSLCVLVSSLAGLAVRVVVSRQGRR